MENDLGPSIAAASQTGRDGERPFAIGRESRHSPGAAPTGAVQWTSWGVVMALLRKRGVAACLLVAGAWLAPAQQNSSRGTQTFLRFETTRRFATGRLP
jgi:hypothetical protein